MEKELGDLYATMEEDEELGLSTKA